MIGSATLLLLAPIAKADLLTSSASSSINFGSVALDTTATDKFTVSIDPGYSLLGGTGSGINAPFSLAFGGCAGTSCTVDESYTATSLGAVGGTLGIDECPNGGGACVAAAIPLSGLGYSVLQAATPSTLSFGSVALNTTKTITFTVPVDKGYSFLGASGAGINSPYSASFSNCNGSNCTVHESYTPTS